MAVVAKESGFVTQKQLYSVVLGVATAVMSTGWIAWQIHAAQPHQHAVEEGEFNRYRDDLGDRLDRIETKLDKVIERAIRESK